LISLASTNHSFPGIVSFQALNRDSVSPFFANSLLAADLAIAPLKSDLLTIA
jgi:hypothetical protein